MTFKLGLTGSIGMGKSTTARSLLIRVVVFGTQMGSSQIIRENGAAVAPLAAIFPQVLKKQAICRTAIKQLISDNSEALKHIENIVHPLVVRDRQLFIEQAKQAVLVFDIPLLYETHSQHQFDAVACVYISPEEQRRRVMDRGTMTAAQLDYILSKQMPIAKKRELSHYQIKTDSLVHVMAQVSVILADIREQVVDA